MIARIDDPRDGEAEYMRWLRAARKQQHEARAHTRDITLLTRLTMVTPQVKGKVAKRGVTNKRALNRRGAGVEQTELLRTSTKRGLRLYGYVGRVTW